MTLDELLSLLRRVLPDDGERITRKLAQTADATRVVAILCDKPWPRRFATPHAGIVQRVRTHVLIGEERVPTQKEIVDSIKYARGNPLGCWIGSPPYGWFVSDPHQVLVAEGTRVDAGTDVAVCLCTLAHRTATLGRADVVACLARDLPELDEQDVDSLAEAMTSYVEAYDSIDDLTSRTNGKLVRMSDFDAHNERNPDEPRYGEARLFGLPELARLTAR
ncbi:hypothetical protein [Polyangium jinanense]|uniref:Uncharacterized protein n=1 Tax=Polyangium jinanense TaxID=2829994 RepID=A0A9X3XEP4_9BACT|nr:hypothetical protein [Polyangium jinanense]MDC3962246.1 hypothetical protein [Polyangium jinanense]MDC3988937.1 hypothetical protein [Polyangium jinanense]